MVPAAMKTILPAALAAALYLTAAAQTSDTKPLSPEALAALARISKSASAIMRQTPEIDRQNRLHDERMRQLALEDKARTEAQAKQQAEFIARMEELRAQAKARQAQRPHDYEERLRKARIRAEISRRQADERAFERSMQRAMEAALQNQCGDGQR
jgi:hypothetical protein